MGDHDRLLTAVPTSLGSTSADENSLSSDVRPHLTTTTATSALSRETQSRETPETPEIHVQKRPKRLSVDIKEILKRLRSTSAGHFGWYGSVVFGSARVERGRQCGPSRFANSLKWLKFPLDFV
jgi:hypothetical protein